MKTNTQTLPLALQPSVLAAAVATADADGINLSGWIGRAVAAFCDAWDESARRLVAIGPDGAGDAAAADSDVDEAQAEFDAWAETATAEERDEVARTYLTETGLVLAPEEWTRERRRIFAAGAVLPVALVSRVQKIADGCGWTLAAAVEKAVKLYLIAPGSVAAIISPALVANP